MADYVALIERLNRGGRVFIDGGTGTEMERREVPLLDNAWNGGGALSHPDLLRQVHEEYISEGAEIIISNTFGTSLHALTEAGEGDRFEEYNRSSVEIALQARQNMNRPDVLVAGGIAYWSWSGKHPTLEALSKSVEAQARVMKETGAELLMLEMMIDLDRMQVTLEAAQTSGLPVWVGLSCKSNSAKEMCLYNGTLLKDALRFLKGRNVPLVSIMHTDISLIEACLDVVDAHWDGLVGVYAHSCEFNKDHSCAFETAISPEGFATHAEECAAREIHLFGGCCGTGPEHMAAARKFFSADA